MNNLYIFDPTKTDSLSRFRGAGRILQILKENFPNAQFITDLNILDNGREKNVKNSIFINPVFHPFQPPATLKRFAKKQIQIIFDVIPLKYPNHFPVGIKGKFNLWLNKLALKNYDQIITISHHSKKDISQYLKIPAEKIEVVYPTVSKTFLNTHNQTPTTKFQTNLKFKSLNSKPISNFQLPISNFCLYVGDVNWNKNLVNLAKAIKIINVTCVFVGKAFEKISNIKNQISNIHIKNQKEKNNLTMKQFKLDRQLQHPWNKDFLQFLEEVNNDKRFIFLGYLDDYGLIKLYQQARVNILVSRDEGFGFSYLEAASQGCPSVLSEIEIFHEIAGDSAWFANPNDPYDIANKIGEIYFNRNLRDKLGKKAYQRSQYFNKTKFKRDFLKALF